MNLAKVIDHTLLKPVATRAQIEKLCAEARQYGFASVCVNPCWVPLCAELLKNSGVAVCTVIGFPLGATTTEAKAFEASDALQNGAGELDMVLNIGALKSGDYETVRQDVRAVREAGDDFILKVIIETSELTRDEKVKACELAAEAGADFVKTSTGFASGGATVEDVRLMKASVPSGVQVKASGGVRTRADVDAMLAAGATRVGASAGVSIIEGK